MDTKAADVDVAHVVTIEELNNHNNRYNKSERER